MALTRSASGPGGLNINTTASNSLFGSGASIATSQAPATGGLFGNTTKPATGGLFGNATPTTASAPAASGGLFGGGSTATTTAPTAGGLFGNANTASSTPQTGGLFGNTTATSQPAQTGGLFGAAAAKPTMSGGLFGNTASAPQQGGGFFGGVSNQAQPAATGGLFGSANNTASTATGGMFGSTQQSNGLLGNTLSGGGLQLGQSTQQQNTVPGVKIDMSNIRPTTRFNDLHESIQKEIEAIDNVIFACQQQSHDITALLPSHGEKLGLLPDSVDFLSRKRIGVESALESDAESLDLVGKLIEQDLHNSTLSFRAVDVLNLPQQYQHAPRHFLGSNNTPQAETGDIVSFFSQAAEDMSTRLATYQQRIAEIEMHLRGVEAATIEQARALNNGSGANVGDEIREVALVLREFESGILAVAGQVGAAREGVQRLQLGGFEQLGGSSQSRTNVNGKRRGIY